MNVRMAELLLMTEPEICFTPAYLDVLAVAKLYFLLTEKNDAKKLFSLGFSRTSVMISAPTAPRTSMGSTRIIVSHREHS